jgi:hypothetical protein
MIVTPRDCVNSENKENHEGALKIMSDRWDVVSSKELIDVWLGKRETQPIASRRGITR